MNLTDQELEKLKASNSAQEWNSICAEVKRTRNGQYPPDWYPRVMLSGVFLEVQATWAVNKDEAQ